MTRHGGVFLPSDQLFVASARLFFPFVEFFVWLVLLAWGAYAAFFSFAVR